jgi:hypothetical protein
MEISDTPEAQDAYAAGVAEGRRLQSAEYALENLRNPPRGPYAKPETHWSQTWKQNRGY